jgi:histidinol dehydrogenase
MLKKNITIVVSAFVVLGLVSGIAYANDAIIDRRMGNIELGDATQEDVKESTIYEMIEIMNENGYRGMAKYMNEHDFESMDDFMNNLTQEDFDTMINIMNENGYDAMGDMMESIGREDMIQMHETMGQYHMENGFKSGSMMGRPFRR